MAGSIINNIRDVKVLDDNGNPALNVTGDVDVEFSSADNLLITNLSVPVAATEVSLALETDVQQILIRSRIRATLQIGLAVGESGSNYITLKPGAVLTLDKMKLNSQTIYLQSDVGSNTIEILQWY